MNLKQAIGKERRREDAEVNIIPVMNIFLLLIPFLLLTAAFVKIAILDLSLPTLDKKREAQQDQSKKLVLVILSIKENSFQLKSPGFKFSPISKTDNKYNYQLLIEQLQEIKEKHTSADEIIISPEAKIKYDIIVKVMDRCRETGFSNVSLAG